MTVTEGGADPESTNTTPATPPTPADPPPANISTNWSGYVVPSSSDPFTSIRGRFTVPTLECASATDGAAASVWVGIGGDTWPDGTSSGALLQTGISATCNGGVQVNDGWWELFPSVPNRAASFLGFPVRAADQIEAMVFQSSTGDWETRVDDLSTGLSGVMVTGQGWGVIADNCPGTFEPSWVL